MSSSEKCCAESFDQLTSQVTNCCLPAGHDGDHDDGAMMWSEETKHVDNFIWAIEPSADEGTRYARWMLMHMRLPAVQQMQWADFIGKYRKLFTTHDGKRYRVTGASHLGDVWLSRDHKRDCGYDLRVSVAECSQWGATA